MGSAAASLGGRLGPLRRRFGGREHFGQNETAHRADSGYKVSTGRNEVRARFLQYLNTTKIHVTHNATPPYTTPTEAISTTNPTVRTLFWLIQGARAITAQLGQEQEEQQ